MTVVIVDTPLQAKPLRFTLAPLRPRSPASDLPEAAMTDTVMSGNSDRWAGPGDRQMARHGTDKDQSGWAMHPGQGDCLPGADLTDEEKEIINSVIARAEKMEAMEQERIGRLVNQLDDMKKTARGRRRVPVPSVRGAVRRAWGQLCGVRRVQEGGAPAWADWANERPGAARDANPAEQKVI
ncbi:hypothetical protein MATL_G00084720 [Megalops atlanticus]|uniref:RabBD domain-containing protein n=1 Tax=Megalops atlanticus TaxID=7932 RepID=A0A9D3Q565_MEGAT|nr:hypothetical protein MATL_G00084720 [Megalops atlanticus]